MPDHAVALTHFDKAAAAVEAWLDGPGAAFATRTRQLDPRRKAASWDIELQHAAHGRQRIQHLHYPGLPGDALRRSRFDKSLCLILPHIEEDGRFCHGGEAVPADFADPIEAMKVLPAAWRLLGQLRQGPAWVVNEFQRESLSYWFRFCLQRNPSEGRPVPLASASA